MNISQQVMRLLNNTEIGEMNLYTIAQELQMNPGAIRRVLNTLMKSDMIEESILCPTCGSQIKRKQSEKRYSIKITVR